MEKLKIAFVFIALWVFAFLVTFHLPKTDRQYRQEGTKVYATITKVTPSVRAGHGDSYECEYVNAEGKNVSAHLILNKMSGEVGQVVEGYYLAEKPGEVYCPPSKLLSYGLMIVADGLAIMLTFFIVVGLFSK